MKLSQKQTKSLFNLAIAFGTMAFYDPIEGTNDTRSVKLVKAMRRAATAAFILKLLGKKK